MNRFFSAKGMALVLLVAIMSLLLAACSDGADGAPGAQGPKGDQGDQGQQGDRGDTGRDGPTGRNGADGKDHWPVTSAMIFGAGVAGQRVVGATDDFLLARDIQLDTGEPDAGGEPLYPENLHAGLLELVGVDPSLQYPGVTPLRGFHG